MININNNRGVQFTFNNGLTISIQIGSGNYCTNRDNSKHYNEEESQKRTTCDNAEIAIWDKDNVWFNFGNDTVKGWVPTEEIGIWIDKVRRAKNIKSIKRVKQNR